MYFNPLGENAEIDAKYIGKQVYQIGNTEIAGGKIKMEPQSFVILEQE